MLDRQPGAITKNRLQIVHIAYKTSVPTRDFDYIPRKGRAGRYVIGKAVQALLIVCLQSFRKLSGETAECCVTLCASHRV
jgi:hypothetical protein